MPSNYHRIGYILEAMPNARIIHCVRPRGEHCVAIFEKLLTESGFEYSNDLGDLLGYHAAYRRMTSDWHERFPGAIHDVDITGLLSGGTMDIESLLRFCGIQSDGAVVSDAQSEPQHLEWSAQRIASNRTAHLAAWRAAQPELWE